MILFTTDSFQINLTHVGLNLNEENSSFYDHTSKNYSLPFTLNLDQANTLKFLSEKNIRIDKVRYDGVLLVGNNIYQANLIVLDESQQILQGVLHYGSNVSALLETKLKNLHWPIIKDSSLTVHAESIVTKKYPEVDYNFPMIIDHEFKKRDTYDDFWGIINYRNPAFSTNGIKLVDNKAAPRNTNLVTPIPYLMGILRTGAEMYGLKLVGDFFGNKANESIMLDVDRFISKYMANSDQNTTFTIPTNQSTEEGRVIWTYEQVFSTTQVGQYRLKSYLALPVAVELKSFEVRDQNKVLLQSFQNNEVNEVVIDIEDLSQIGDITIELKVYNNDYESLADYSHFNFYVTGTKYNAYPDTFTLGEVMPDITFGRLLEYLKNWLNLDIDFTKNELLINYNERSFLELDFRDLTRYEDPKKKRKFNDLEFYNLVSNSKENILVSRSGIEHFETPKESNGLRTINNGVSVLHRDVHLEIETSGRRSTDSAFRIALYDGLQNSMNVAVASIYGKTFRLDEVYQDYWLKWLDFRLNSLEITDKFKIHSLDDIDIKQGLYKYNRKGIFKKLSKRRVAEDDWEVTAVFETIR